MTDKRVNWALRPRLSRRRVLAAGGASAGVAALAACRGGNTASPSASSSPQKAPAVHRGGTLNVNLTTVPPSLDPFRSNSVATENLASWVYSRLYKFQTGPGVDPSLYTPVPDLATSYEAPDAATWTFKLRPDAKMHDVPPTNGRSVTAQDVVYSFNRFNGAAVNPAKGDLSMVDSVTATDPNTVQFKLKYPYSPFLSLATSPKDFWIMPHELDEVSADKGGDAQQHMVGSGPFIFKSYQQAQSLSFARNPNYWVKGTDGQSVPYVDGMLVTLLTDTNAALAQFNAGHMDILGSVTLQQMQQLKQQNSNFQIITTPSNVYFNIIFQPTSFTANQAPFSDVRVRRAMSLAIDRDGLNKLLFDGQGGWDDVAIPAGFKYWWLDPKSPDMGPGAQWYKHDPAQAKQLLAAAGYDKGLSVTQHTTDAYGAQYAQAIDAVGSMLQQAGITVKLVTDNYQSVWIPDVYSGHFEGFFATYIAFYDPDIYFHQALTLQGTFASSHVNDPQINQLLDQEQKELDRTKRRALVFEIQKRASDQMFQVPLVSGIAQVGFLPNIHDYYSNASSFAIGTETYPFVWKE